MKTFRDSPRLDSPPVRLISPIPSKDRLPRQISISLHRQTFSRHDIDPSRTSCELRHGELDAKIGDGRKLFPRTNCLESIEDRIRYNERACPPRFKRRNVSLISPRLITILTTQHDSLFLKAAKGSGDRIARQHGPV